MVFGRAFSKHLLIIIEKVRIDLVQKPLLPHHRLVGKGERGGTDPVEEGARWPCVREWQMEKLEDGEERPESVDVPMLVFFGDAS